jgi:hypothetical protein
MSNPTSVEESSAAEEYYYKKYDDQSGRVHFLSLVLGWRGPASWRPLTRMTNIGYSTPRGQDRA